MTVSKDRVLVADPTSDSTVSRPAAAWERDARDRLAEDEPFLALDLARRGLLAHPDSLGLTLVAVEALAGCGAADQARQLLLPWVETLGGDLRPTAPDDDEDGDAPPLGPADRFVMICRLDEDPHADASARLERLRRIIGGLGRRAEPPAALAAWGPVIVAIADRPGRLAAIALATLDLAGTLPETDDPAPVRIWLDIDTVSDADLSIPGHPGLHGALVDRAPGLELLTPPGRIYASRRFADALEGAEIADGDLRLVREPIGRATPARGLARQQVVHLRPEIITARPEIADDPEIATAEPPPAMTEDVPPAPSFSDTDLALMLAEAVEALSHLDESRTDAPPLMFGTVFADCGQAAPEEEMEVVEEEEESSAPLPDIGAPLSDEDIAALLSETEAEPEPSPVLPPAAPDIALAPPRPRP